MRRIIGPKRKQVAEGWKKVIKFRKMWLARHVARKLRH